MKGEGATSGRHEKPFEQPLTPTSDWDILNQVGQHDKDFLENYSKSEFGERESAKEKAFSKVSERFMRDEEDGKISPEFRKIFEAEMQKRLNSQRKDLRRKFAEQALVESERYRTGVKRQRPETENPIPNEITSSDDTNKESALSGNPESKTEEQLIHDAFNDPAFKAEAVKRAKEQKIAEAKQSAAIQTKQEQILQNKDAQTEKSKPHNQEQPKENSEKFQSEAELDAAIAAAEAELATSEDKIKTLEKSQHRFIAINADFTRDKRELARQYAERELNAENARSNFLKRLWKGDLFKKYYWKKYEREILDGKRKISQNGESVELDEILKKRSGDVIKRFMMGVIDDPETSRFIHRNIGGEGKGEKLEEADAETTERIRNAIKNFAGAKLKQGETLDDLKRKFAEDLRNSAAEEHDRDGRFSPALYDNYYDIAVQVRECAEHNLSVDRVMEGFKVYNVKVRNNQRTKEHLDNLDRAIDKVERSVVGSILPGEVIAAAVSSAYSLTQFGIRAKAGLGLGLGTAGLFAGSREYTHIIEDRSRVMRDAAEGLAYDSTRDISELSLAQKHLAKKRAKYEAKIGGTLYQIKPATELAENIMKAIDERDSEKALHAIAEAKIRTDYSDSEQKDLISYSSADKMGEERLRLDLAIIAAEKVLTEQGREKLANISAVVEQEINESVQTSDRKFRKLRLAQSLKRAGKTIAIGAAFAATAEEIVASISPNKISLFEKAGLLHHENNENASETILAGIAGPRAYTESVAITGAGSEQIAENYRAAGFEVTKTADAHTEFQSTTRPIGIEEVGGINTITQYANNSTAYADGNELGLRIDNATGSVVMNYRGNSTLQSGEIIDVARGVAEGKAHLIVRHGSTKVEVPAFIIDPASGQITFGQNGSVFTTSGEMMSILGPNGERCYDSIQFVLDNGVDENTVHHLTAIATSNGDGVVGEITKTFNIPTEHPAEYVASRIVQRDVSGAGFVSPLSSRTGLGAPVSAETEENT